MLINRDKPDRWKEDIAASVNFYNEWFMRFAPRTYREAREEVSQTVREAIEATDFLERITPKMLRESPNALLMFRMATAPPLARDRLGGLAAMSRYMIKRMEERNSLPVHMSEEELDKTLSRACHVISRVLDHELFPWLDEGRTPQEGELRRASTVVADRLTGATADPIIRNAQERRQLTAIKEYLEWKGYKQVRPVPGTKPREVPAGTFTFRFIVIAGKNYKVNIPVDVVLQPRVPRLDKLPIFIEAKSAGDFTNTNKRRKEEATKMRQLKEAYGSNVEFVLFLNGYFDSGYLGYEAAEGIDWVWEHRIEDLDDLEI